MATAEVHHITHPLVQHKLTLMRDKDTSTNSFRRLLNEISMLMAYEVTRDMPTQLIEVETPLETMQAPVIEGRKTVFVSIMRAGAGFLDGMLNVVPGARIGHIGLYRDPKTLIAVEYYFKMPGRHARGATRSCSTRCSRPATPRSPRSTASRRRDRSRSASSACSRRQKGCATSMLPTRTCRSTRRRSTGNSTSTATSCPDSATRATACSGRSSYRSTIISKPPQNMRLPSNGMFLMSIMSFRRGSFITFSLISSRFARDS